MKNKNLRNLIIVLMVFVYWAVTDQGSDIEALVAFILMIIGALMQCYQIMMGKIKVVFVSRILWAIINVTILLSYLANNQGQSSLKAAGLIGMTVYGLLTLACAFIRYSRDKQPIVPQNFFSHIKQPTLLIKLYSVEVVCVLCCLISLAFWTSAKSDEIHHTTQAGHVAYIFAVMADFIATIPTLVWIMKDANVMKDKPVAYLLMLGSYTATLKGLEQYTAESLTIPVEGWLIVAFLAARQIWYRTIHNRPESWY